MTTLRQIITDAFRQSNLIGAGESPDAPEFEEALRKLTTFISGLYGHELGEPLQTLNFGSENLTSPHAKRDDLDDYVKSSYVPSNVRLRANNESSCILFLDPHPEDGARVGVVDVAGNLATKPITLNGNGNNIEGTASVTLTTNGVNKEWFYRADLGNWVPVTGLTADSEAPLPSEFDDYFITSLALRINPSYGVETRAETMSVLNRTLSRIRSRYRQRNNTPIQLGLQRMDRAVFGFYDKAFELGITR